VTDSPAVILTADFWRKRFGGDEHIVGSTVRIDGKSLTVVGIVPAFLNFEGQFDLWLSPTSDNGAEQRANRFWLAAGRTRPGMPRQQEQERLRQLCRALAETYPASNRDWGVDVADLKESLVGDTRTQLLVLSGSVFFVLLIVCANVAALYVVRATVRQRELSIRASLGASRARILRQLLTESAVIAVVASVLGAALAAGAVSLIREHGPRDLPRLEEIQVDTRALQFAAGLAIFVGLLSGVAPAVQSVRRDPQPGMREAGRGSTEGRRNNRARAVLVSAEVALSVVLLSGSALLVKSFRALAHEDVGFRTDHLLTLFVSMPSTKFLAGGKYQSAKVAHYIDRLATALRSLPGVSNVGVGMYAPVGGGGYQTWQKFRVLGENGREEGMVHGINQVVTPEYFATLGIPLRTGRLFTSADSPGSAAVVLINQAFARARFGQTNPLGRRVMLEDETKPREIVGVVGDIKPGLPSETAPPQIFLPEAQSPVPMLTVFVRTRQDPALLTTAVERRVLDVDADVPAYRVRTAEELLSRSLAAKRFVMQLMSSFAGLSVALALIGLYGVLAYSVAQRTREFGVRVALGARPAQVVSLVLQQGLGFVLAGVVSGLLGAIALTKVMGSLLYNVSPRDPAVLSMVAAAVFGAAVLSCWLPARRAAKVDAAVALRWE
jgi:putative ABC transport system permease protein